MDCRKAENYIKEFRRMCEQSDDECTDCPIAYEDTVVGLCCSDFQRVYPAETVKIVQKWSDEHPMTMPKSKPKTYMEDYFEKFPNAPKRGAGIPAACRYFVYGIDFDTKKCLEPGRCVRCWNEPIKEEGGE